MKTIHVLSSVALASIAVACAEPAGDGAQTSTSNLDSRLTAENIQSIVHLCPPARDGLACQRTSLDFENAVVSDVDGSTFAVVPFSDPEVADGDTSLLAVFTNGSIVTVPERLPAMRAQACRDLGLACEAARDYQGEQWENCNHDPGYDDESTALGCAIFYGQAKLSANNTCQQAARCMRPEIASSQSTQQ